MGVHGLWKLLEPSSQMVPLESLAGKVLAVDVSIWLHQAIKGMCDTHGAPIEAAHLVVLFHRLCKLLFYKIKPIFVFDGGTPALKHQTLAARRNKTRSAKTEALKVREKLIKNLLKHEAIRQVLANETATAALGLNSFALPGPAVEEDLYKLPPAAADCEDSLSSEEMESDGNQESEKYSGNIHSVDVTSKEFLSLSPEIRHDILTELIETRKQSSWGSLNSMPKDSDSFSDFQMNRLLKRHAVQASLEQVGKEMGGRALSIKELESLLEDRGVVNVKDLPSKRIAQDNVTRYMLIQKESALSTEAEKRKEFDIMDHLDEIDEFSESDGEISRRKSSMEPKPKKEILDGNESGGANESSTSRRESIKKELKVKFANEMDQILTILDDDYTDSEKEVKLRDPQNRFDFSKDMSTAEQETKNKKKISIEAKAKEIKQIGAEVTSQSEAKKEETVENLTDQKNNFDASKNMSEIKADEADDNLFESKMKDLNEIRAESIQPEDSNVKKMEMITFEAFEFDSVEENISSSKRTKTELANENERSNENRSPLPTGMQVEAATEISVDSSSSDSESDFVLVTAENIEGKPIEKIEEGVEEVYESETKTDFQDLSVRVGLSEISKSDDLFADVFRNDREAEMDDEGASVRSVETTDERVKESSEGKKIEFEKNMSAEELTDLKKSLEEKQYNLLMEKGKQERLALNPTDQMYSDAQELLRLFGVPFVVAPMEAEAQCAVLNTLGLTEGTITNDSDIWLFGGKVVYKNFFNQKKHVLEYSSENIRKCFKLNREDLIRMAMLLGSDYTVGLNGIGPVTALEILASFPSRSNGLFDGLENFRDWFVSGTTKTNLRNKIRNAVISPGFPNKAVAEAYLNPQVDDSKEPFSWAKPDLDLIKKYVKVKIGWSSDKCNDLLQPVLKKLAENSSQSIIQKYFKTCQRTETLSKRVENAVKQLGGDEVEDDSNSVRKPKMVRKNSSKQRKCEEPKRLVKKSRLLSSDDSTSFHFNFSPSKEALIKEKLHREEKIPQKEKAQKLLVEKRREAIEIFRMFGTGRGRKKTKVFAKKEANLSESSSDSN